MLLTFCLVVSDDPSAFFSRCARPLRGYRYDERSCRENGDPKWQSTEAENLNAIAFPLGGSVMNVSELGFSMEALITLCQRYRVRELALFGSARRADFSAESDIDWLVEFEPDAQVGFMTLSRMQRELAAIFKRRVDLVPKRGLKPLIRQAVLESAEVLYAA